MFNTRVDSNFINSLANARHRFRIRRFQPLLKEMQEVSDKSSGILRKRSDIVERRSYPEDWFLGHWGSIQLFVYIVNVALPQTGTDGSRSNLDDARIVPWSDLSGYFDEAVTVCPKRAHEESRGVNSHL
jgi:hypothetical protein